LAKILLADDSTHAQRMGAKILTAEGHQVSTVSNGQAAIHALEEAVPELVIADVFMPGRNGYEVCHFVKSDDKLKNIPVLLIIGAMEPYDPEEGRRAGADGLITKPLESSSLLSTVNDLLAAAKRFAPARAAVKQTDYGEIALEEPQEVVEETPQWDETPEEIISTVQEQKLEIPAEMNEQPIGMLTDVMRADAAAHAPVMEAPIEASMERSMKGAEVPEPESNEPASLLPDPASLPQLDIAEKTTWSAEPAEMTAAEAKLFELPSANWDDLEQLVEQTAAAQPAPAPAPLPWQMSASTSESADGDRDPALETREDADVPIAADPLLYRPPEVPTDIPADPAIEHYESLDAVVEAQGPVGYKAEPPPPPEETAAPGEEEAAAGQEFSGPVEELEAAPGDRNLPPVEQLVRQAIEDLMPEIIDRVKQSLKS